ncbi:MAG: hypothetical protein MJZ64_06100 [Paludibacteraceae bacterium]|nr:hypothetical protein [Paludibacteraceae bacterium]
MKRVYNIPQTEIVCPNMPLMTESVRSAVGNPSDIDEGSGIGTAPARKLYV